MNKASGDDGISVELFQILKVDAVKVLHSICQQIWKTQQWPQDWKSSVFIPIPKKGKAKECSNYHTIALISHASKKKKQPQNSPSQASTVWASLVAQMVKHLPAMQETGVQSLGQEDLLEKEMATHSSILAWKILWSEELQQYVNPCELPDVQTEFRKSRGTRDQIANIRWIFEKAGEFQKNIYFCFIDYAKAKEVMLLNCGVRADS